jgi:hypothetical protein
MGTLAAKLALALPLLKPMSTAEVQLDILPLLQLAPALSAGR